MALAFLPAHAHHSQVTTVFAVFVSPMKFEEIQLATNPPNSSPSADIYIKYIPKLQNPILKIMFLLGEHFIVLIILTACPTDAWSCCPEKMLFCSFSLGKPGFFAFDKLKYPSASNSLLYFLSTEVGFSFCCPVFLIKILPILCL